MGVYFYGINIDSQIIDPINLGFLNQIVEMPVKETQSITSVRWQYIGRPYIKKNHQVKNPISGV